MAIFVLANPAIWLAADEAGFSGIALWALRKNPFIIVARLIFAGRESIEMARVQWKWRWSNENGVGNKFRGASKKFRDAGNKFRDQLPGTYIHDGGYFD